MWGGCAPPPPPTCKCVHGSTCSVLGVVIAWAQISEKIRYAKWKTVDIMKALKEGRVPRSGPFGEVTCCVMTWQRVV